MGADTSDGLRAIDLYSGIGGWALGLRLAGAEVVSSYEWWGPANATHALNFRDAAVHEVDIRALDPKGLPRVDLVVGSPPCTQFSFANRGGNGDIADGLKDIAILTRQDRLFAIFVDILGAGNSRGQAGSVYGPSTSHMGKLLPKLDSGGAGGCPVLAIWIGPAAYDPRH